jgi:hypothetical protein
MAIKHTEETSKCAEAWRLCVMEQTMTMEETKINIIKRGEFRHQRAFSGPQDRQFNSSDEQLPECVIGKWKNGPPITRKTKRMHCKRKFRRKISKTAMVW